MSDHPKTANGSSTSESLSKWYQEVDHPTWYETFSEHQREKMLGDDLTAGRTVPLLLTAVIFVGVVLALVSVLALW